MNHITIALELFGKTYHIKCPEDSHAVLEKAAKLLQEKMMKMRSTGNVLCSERLAIITALNLAYDLLSLEGQSTQHKRSLEDRLTLLNNKIESALHPHVQLELQAE